MQQQPPNQPHFYPSQQQPPYPPQPSAPGWSARPPQGEPWQQTAPPPPVYQPPAPVKPKRKKWPWIVGVIVAFLVIGTINAIISNGNGVGNTTTGSQPTQAAPTQVQTQAPAATPTPTPRPTPSFATFGDGTFQVGKDIQPGTYRTRAATPGCYYARLSSFAGGVSSILSNQNTDFPAIVTISATDKGFQSQGCGTWTKDLSRITSSKTSFTDGMYFVGTDIEPGTYKSSGQTGCYYARLAGFSGGLSDIISNDNTDTPAIVTISASDAGFDSQGCGTWTRM